VRRDNDAIAFVVIAFPPCVARGLIAAPCLFGRYLDPKTASAEYRFPIIEVVKDMRRLTIAVIMATMPLVLSGAGRAFACEGDKVLLAENFSAADASWGDQSNNFTIKDGSAVIKADSRRGYKALDNAFLFDDADICVTATAVEIGKPDGSAGGLVFWAQDYRNAYFLLLASNGYFKIGRLVNAAWVNPPLDWTQSEAIAQGINKPNRLRLTTKGQTLTVEINGKPGTTLQAQCPSAPSLIGLYAESSEKVDTWKFNDLKVTNAK
jgi:hypothetical protein